MSVEHDPRHTRKAIRLHCGRFLVRTLKAEDATERWANWLLDPLATQTLNSSARGLTRDALVNYIKRFDQRTHLLVGIFEKSTRTHVGLIRFDIDFARNRALASLFIGEPAYRDTGVTSAALIPSLDHAFNVLGLETVAASVLLRHRVMIQYLLKTGWKMDPVRKPPIKSNTDDTMVEVRSFTLARADWIAWKQSKVAKRLLRTIRRP